MSYKEIIYSNALKIVDRIYRESKYNEDVDFFRIPDVINSVNDNQIASKEWLINNLIPILNNWDKKITNVHVVGAWYGLTSLLLRHHLKNKNIDIWNIDLDPMCEIVGRQLVGSDEHTHWIIASAIDAFIEDQDRPDIIVNTSCEHIEQQDLNLICKLKKKHALICFQSNNYEDIDSHINCHNSLGDFVDSLKLEKVLFQSELARENYARYMVVGY